MESNLKEMERVLNYIEEHLLEEKLDLSTIAAEIGYSKYHLHRMFTSVVGFTLHSYIQRRRLTEAARLLVFTHRPILEIALCAGYETQRSFSAGFKAMFHCSPKVFRERGDFLPLQLKYDIRNRKQLRGDMILDIKIAESDSISLIGYSGSTKRGFFAIARCWRLLNANKNKICGRIDEEFLIGVDDYSVFEEEEIPVFKYIAAAQVNTAANIPKGMQAFELPPCKYVIFTFRGRNEDSMQSIAEYIYQQWFPNSTCLFNERNRYDLAKYGENVDENGQSEIQFWVPIV